MAIESNLNKSGHHLAAKVLGQAERLKKQGGNRRFRLTFCGSAGHMGIAGNEEADKEAKTAADGEQSDKKDLPPCLRKQLGYSLSVMITDMPFLFLSVYLCVCYPSLWFPLLLCSSSFQSVL